MQVDCKISFCKVQGQYGLVDGTVAECSRCEHSTESCGTHDGSVKRCLVLMREECPEGEHNFYVDEDEP